MTQISLEITGLDELQRATAKFPREMDRGIQVAMQGGTEILREGVAPYPPASDANLPQPGIPGARWYERGRGAWYVRKRTGEAVNYGGSERLGSSWTTKISRSRGGWLGIIGASASYAGEVHDAALQAAIFAQRGWKTVQDSVRTGAAKVQRLFNVVIRGVLRRVGL